MIGAMMTEEQIKYMVDRFLSWELPKDFTPDGGVTYTRPNYRHPAGDGMPYGTNILDWNQAIQMVRHMIEGMPS